MTIDNLKDLISDEVFGGLQKALKDKISSCVEGFHQEHIIKIFDNVFSLMQTPEQSRWYDPYHILFSTGFALKLVEAIHQKNDNYDISLKLKDDDGNDIIHDIRLIVPAILLHDVGYYAVADKSLWSGAKSRITHMQEGTAKAAYIIAKNVPNDGNDAFEPDEIQEIIGMIAVHDNPYVKEIELPLGHNPLRLAMRDCDRVWVMHFLSFYKDWLSKEKGYLENGNAIGDFLNDRTVQFLAWDPVVFLPSKELIKKNATSIECPNYSSTRKIILQLIEKRGKELENDTPVLENLIKNKDLSTQKVFEDFGLVGLSLPSS